MDWVDFKRHVIRYRKPYNNRYDHIYLLLISTVNSYTSYKSFSYEGCGAYDCAELLGVFLYNLAELENMIHPIQYKKIEEFQDNEWGFIDSCCNTIKAYHNDTITDEELLLSVAKIIRAYFHLVYSNHTYRDGVKSAVHMLKEKNGY